MTGGDSKITARSAGENRESPSPGLLPPQALPTPSSLVGAYVIAGGLALGAVFMGVGGFLPGDAPAPRAFVPGDTGGAGKTFAISADQAPGAFKVLPSNVQNAPGSVLAQLQMPEAEKRRLAEKLTDGSVRLAAVTLWDRMDEDGDVVEVSAAGFSQRLVIVHKPKVFFLPVQPGGSVTIRALRDGGGGGVTLGLSTIIGPVPLPPLAPGQTVEIPAL